MSLPYRTELKTHTEEQLARSNDLRAAHGEAVFESTDDALFDIDLASEASESDITHWLAHPDERVAAHLLDAVSNTSRIERWCGRHVRDVHGQVVAALIARAEADGLLWTPLLDQAVSKLIWMQVADDAPLEGVATPREQWDRLIPWIEQERDPARLAGLLDFACKPLSWLVARHGASLDRSLMVRLSHDDQNLDALAANPALTGKALEWLIIRVIECKYSDTQILAIRELNRRGVGVSERVFRTSFLDTAKEAEADTRHTFPPSADLPHRKARRLLAELEGLTKAQLEALTIDLRAGIRQAGAWHRIAVHPAADLSLIQQAYEAMEGDDRVQEAMLRDLAKREDVLANPYFRDEIRIRGDWLTRLAVLDDLSEQESELLAAEMLRRARPEEMIAMLETPGRRIPRAVAEALLQHNDQKVRLAATCALAETLETPKRAAARRGAALG